MRIFRILCYWIICI